MDPSLSGSTFSKNTTLGTASQFGYKIALKIQETSTVLTSGYDWLTRTGGFTKTGPDGGEFL